VEVPVGVVKRWTLAAAIGLATFCGCWWGLEAGAGWQRGDALGLAAVPFSVVFGVASFWASQQNRENGSEASATAKPSVLSYFMQVINHPTGTVIAGDLRGARINFGRPRNGLILAAAVMFAVDAVAILIAVMSPRPVPAGGPGLTVPEPPWVTYSTGVKETLTRGEKIRYAFYVDNPTGKEINANVRVDAYWETRDEPQLNIFNRVFQRYLPPGRTTVYSPWTTIPSDALPGMYSEQTDVADRAVPTDRAGRYGLFEVSGREILSIPCYVQPTTLAFSGADGGPASVAMVLSSHRGNTKPTVGDVQRFAASSVNRVAPAAGGPVTAEFLEYLLEHYGISSSDISQIYQDEPGDPQTQLTSMAIAIKQGSPVIAFVDGADLPAGGNGTRNYTAHWLVVAGFGLSGSDQPEVLVNDPDGTRGYGGVKDQPIVLAAFGKAVLDASSLPLLQQEPQHVSGIVITSP
jgi:hypothetical protein